MKNWKTIREEMMSTDPSGTGKAGFSSKADDEGPVAGYDKGMKKKKKKYATAGHGSRRRWMTRGRK
tara:strand:- start:118 stop:315 length:198 start_codon:yes stop_codon:yes gene_type:complete